MANNLRSQEQPGANETTPVSGLPSKQAVLITHVVQKTKGDMAEITALGAARTAKVLEHFDSTMSQADQDILEGMRTRIEAPGTSFLAEALAALEGL